MMSNFLLVALLVIWLLIPRPVLADNQATGDEKNQILYQQNSQATSTTDLVLAERQKLAWERNSAYSGFETSQPVVLALMSKSQSENASQSTDNKPVASKSQDNNGQDNKSQNTAASSSENSTQPPTNQTISPTPSPNPVASPAPQQQLAVQPPPNFTKNPSKPELAVYRQANVTPPSTMVAHPMFENFYSNDGLPPSTTQGLFSVVAILLLAGWSALEAPLIISTLQKIPLI